MLGGVCSGLASYMNIDPAIVRLLFAIVTLGGFGFGIPIYILLWIVLPARSLEDFVGKRLFRNPEERILGGVAGGLAAYFNKEVWVFRLIFAAPLLLNILISIISALTNGFDGPENIFVGSFTGTFTLAYIVLWIVLPEARSPFERMEMRGEKVDVNRIWQNVQQNMSGFENRAKAWGEEVTSTASNLGNQAGRFASTRGRSFAAEVAQSGRTVSRGIGHIIGVLFKAFFLFVFGIIAFVLFIAVVAFTAGGLARPVNDFMLDGFWQKAFMWGTLVFFLAVPLIAIITWIVRRLMKVRSQKRYLGWTFGGLWTLGWISLFLLIATVAKDFRNYDEVAQSIAVARPAGGKLNIRVDEPRIRYSGSFDWINDDDRDDGGWDLTEDTLRLSNVKMRFLKSTDSSYHVTLWKYSRGQNRADAAERAERLSYNTSLQDNALVLGSGYGIGKAQKFRAQQVIVEVRVPVGRQVRFRRKRGSKLRPTYYNMRNNQRSSNYDWERDWDFDERFGANFQLQTGVDYTMTETGELVDASQRTTTDNTDTYRYKGDSLDNQIQELQRQRDEENRRRDEEIERSASVWKKKTAACRTAKHQYHGKHKPGDQAEQTGH
jgi:phage shock protein PspC (stress-responsive transcriptional regulator)